MVTTFGNPPSQCDICKCNFGRVIYDCKHPILGSWCFIDQRCFDSLKHYGIKLGLGLGQKWVRRDDGKYVKDEEAS